MDEEAFPLPVPVEFTSVHLSLVEDPIKSFGAVQVEFASNQYATGCNCIVSFKIAPRVLKLKMGAEYDAPPPDTENTTLTRNW